MPLGVEVSSLRSKELDMKASNKTTFGSSQGDALLIRGRSDKRDFKNQKSNSRFKSRSKKPFGVLFVIKDTSKGIIQRDERDLGTKKMDL